MIPFATYIIPEPDKSELLPSEKWLWIVLNQPPTLAHEELLQKICQALKADFATDVYVQVCDPSHQVQFPSLNIRKIKLVLSFGIQPQTLGIWIDLNSPGIRFLEAFSFILSVSLDELIHHPLSKKQLWSSMQSFMQAAETYK